MTEGLLAEQRGDRSLLGRNSGMSVMSQLGHKKSMPRKVFVEAKLGARYPWVVVDWVFVIADYVE